MPNHDETGPQEGLVRPAKSPVPVDLHARAERLAADNARLRTGIATILDRAQNLPHVVMPNGDPLSLYCRQLLIGPPTSS